MRGFQRLASAARGTLWLLRATGLRDHFSKVEHHLHDLDAKVLHVASQSTTALQVADSVHRLERQISDVMADVTSQHTTMVRVAESVQRLGKHIVDVAAHNLTNGRLSQQFQKLEKHVSEIGAHHAGNGKLTEQFQKLERHLNETTHSLFNGKLTERFRQLESALAGSHKSDTLPKLEKQLADLAAGNVAAQRELGERFQRLEKQLAAAAPAAQLAEQFQRLEQRLEALHTKVEQAASGYAEMHRQQEQTRWLQAKDLRAYERQVHSPNGEDGILQEILQRIGVEARYFVEVGLRSGTQSNCARLAFQENWPGLFIAADHGTYQELTERYRSTWGVHCLQGIATARNIEQLLAENAVPFNLDVLSIDLHGNDYWLWNALNRWRPRVLLIEYNAHCAPAQKWVMQENPDPQVDGTNRYGASLASLAALGHRKGYTLVATDSSGKTAFFVRDDLATPERFLDSAVQYHYSPPRLGSGVAAIPPGSGPHLEI